MDTQGLQKAAPPAVAFMMMFVPFSAQWLFFRIEPGPLRKGEAYTLNALVITSLICYWRTCVTDPGRIPRDWNQSEELSSPTDPTSSTHRQRWCRKCEAFKPPRSHHCKTCKRCVPKMDHHCVWTANCISHVTLPNFLRLLIYSVVSMICIEYFLYQRCAVLWQKRNLPSYLGPSAFQLAHLFFLVVSNSFLLFVLAILLARTLWSATLNMTTIEGWEIERHEALLRRARVLGGYLVGPGGNKMRIERQEFPWDVGIWTNICESFGSRNPLVWLWPFAKSPSVESGLSFEHNGIEDPSKPWPPPDPDRAYRVMPQQLTGNVFTQLLDVDDFRRRQRADFARYTDLDGDYVVRRQPFHERLEAMTGTSRGSGGEDGGVTADRELNESDSYSDGEHDDDENDNGGEEAWRNKEGERLKDFGVDEVAEFYDEDDHVPLAELMRRKDVSR